MLAAHETGKLPFYENIPTQVRAITLNYTAFLQQRLGAGQALHFHGGLAEYVRMDTRDLLPIENIYKCDPAKFIREIVAPNIDVSSENLRQQKHVIPALVPPLRLKPILSHRYIELWGRASAWVKEAKHIVIVGYSFNNADEHFNDILRCHPDRKVDIVVPEAVTPEFVARMEKVFGTATNQYSTVKVNGHEAVQARKIRLIKAKADEIDVAALFNQGVKG